MAFGQSSGPPASAQQLTRLAELLGEAGYDSFREARHPFGLTQRQSNGKFSRTEAGELIDRLEAAPDDAAEDGPGDGPGPAAPRPAAPRAAAPRAAAPRVAASGVRRPSAPSVRPARTSTAAGPDRRPSPSPDPELADVADEALVAELARRGWTCTPPP